MADELSNNAQRVYAFIIRYCEMRQGVRPSYREIKEGCNLPSVADVHPLLLELDADGKIELDKEGRARYFSIDGAVWTSPQKAHSGSS